MVINLTRAYAVRYAPSIHVNPDQVAYAMISSGQPTIVLSNNAAFVVKRESYERVVGYLKQRERVVRKSECMDPCEKLYDTEGNEVFSWSNQVIASAFADLLSEHDERTDSNGEGFWNGSD